MKPTLRFHRGFVAATLGLTAGLALPVVFSGSILLAQAAPQPFAQPHEAAAHSVALRTVSQPAVPQSRQLAAQKLHAARKAVATRDIATAERLLNEVAAMELTFQVNEDQPTRVQKLIQDYRWLADQSRTQGHSEQFRQQYARFLLIQADTMLRRNELDLATQLTQEAVKQQVQHYSPEDRNNGLEPTAMGQRISDARRIQNLTNESAVAGNHTQQIPQQPLSQAAQAVLEQALQTLQQARSALDAGQFEQAEQLARQAGASGLPESAFPQNNSPNRFLSEVAARRQGMTVPPPVDPQVVQASNSQPVLPASIPVPGRKTPFIDQTLTQRQAVLSQINSDVIQQLADAKRLTMTERKPEAALEILYNLKRRIEQSNQLDSQTRGTFVQMIDREVAETVSFRERYASQEKQDRINESVWADLRQDQARFLNKEEQLSSMFREYKKLIDDQRFEEALIIAKKAREFAPDSPEANVLATTAQMLYNVNRTHDIRDLKRDGVLEAFMDVDRASVIPDFRGGSMIYSPDWASLSGRRQASNRNLQYQRPAAEQRIIRQLEMPVSFNVNQPVPLEHALQMLCGAVDITHFMDRTALQEADVPSGTMVVIPAANGIKMRSVLITILDQLGLAYVVKNEMLNITSKRRAQGDLIVRTYYVGDLIPDAPDTMSSTYASDAFNRSYDKQNPYQHRNGNTSSGMPAQGAPVFDGMPLSNYQVPNVVDGDPNVLAQFGGGMGGMSGGMGGMGGGMGGMGGGMMGGMGGGMGGMGGGMMGGMGGMGGGMMGGMGGGMGGMGGMMGGMGFGSVYQIIQTVIEPESWQDMGMGGEGIMNMYPATQSLAVRQTEEVHAQIEDLLTQIRKMHDLQIAVEVRYITLNDQFYEKMGTAFDMAIRDDNAFGRISQVENIFPNTEATNTTSMTTRGDNVVVGMSSPGVFTANASIPLSQDSFSAAIPPFGGYNPAAGISTGFAILSNLETYFFVQAAQGDRRNSVMEAPKVMLQNGQPGMISDYTEIPFVTSVIPVVADFAVSYQPVITLLNAGNVLNVRATVSNDRHHVRLALNPTFTTLVRTETFKFFGDDEVSEETSTTRGDDTATTSTDPRSTATNRRVATSGITIQQPVLATFAVSTTVSCPDGGTVLLGGIKRLSEGRVESGVPMLNKLPYISRLFANQAIGRDTQSVMIMVTPRIIIREEEEDFIMGRSSP